MQFSIVAVAMFAGAVMAGEVHTIYQTEQITITSCAETVTDCPARSTVTSLTSYPVAPTSYPAAVTTPPVVPTYPVYSNVSTPAAPTSYPSGEETTPAAPAPPADTNSYSVITISTCIPTVVYSTVIVTPTPTYAPVSPPISTGTVVVPGNTTSPTTPSAPIFTGAASAVRGSFAVAAAAGLVALLL